MGISISLLSACTVSFIGAACFAAGYLFSVHSFRSVDLNDEDDDKEEQRKKNINKGARRIFYLVQDLVRWKAGDKRKIDAITVADQKSRNKKYASLEIEGLAEILEDFKMVLVVRNDLKMGKGKIAAQCSHATLGLYKKLHNRAPKALSRWEMCGQVKVVLRTESEEDMLVLQERAKSLKLPTHITIDAGRTQIAPNSRTVMAILGPADVVDDVTGGLKLL